MDYPPDFPPQARARVEAEMLKGIKDLERGREKVVWSEDEANLRKYILRVFLVFGQEACKLGWPVDRIRREADEFLRKFTIEAYDREGHDKHGRKLREMIDRFDGSIRPDVRREF
jgi:hypothetical protein